MRPVFVVSLARSGSTLLRYLLDAHPQIVGPPELNLSALLQHVVEVWAHVNDARGIAPPSDGKVPPELSRRARKVVDDIMATFVAGTGATLFCDKSLTTVDHLRVVTACYPDASYIYLYRYPLDFIASGIEASQWGYNAYGFAPYVAGNVGNFVAGLASYWIDRVTKMLESEKSSEAARSRIYYELLCDDPAGTLSDVLRFLDLEPDEQLLARAFEVDHGRGPGDYKIDYTRSVSLASVGRGSTIPQLLGAAQVSRMNELLSELDYPPLEAAWRGDLGSLLGLKSAQGSIGESRRIAEQLVAALDGTGSPRLSDLDREVLPLELAVLAGASGASILVVEKDGSVGLAGDAPSTGGESGTRPRVNCIGDVLLKVVAGELDLGRAVHEGKLRVDVGSTSPEARDWPRRVLQVLASVLRPAG